MAENEENRILKMLRRRRAKNIAKESVAAGLEGGADIMRMQAKPARLLRPFLPSTYRRIVDPAVAVSEAMSSGMDRTAERIRSSETRDRQSSEADIPITYQMEMQLRDLGYSNQQIQQMTTKQATRIILSRVTSPSRASPKAMQGGGNRPPSPITFPREPDGWPPSNRELMRAALDQGLPLKERETYRVLEIELQERYPSRTAEEIHERVVEFFNFMKDRKSPQPVPIQFPISRGDEEAKLGARVGTVPYRTARRSIEPDNQENARADNTTNGSRGSRAWKNVKTSPGAVASGAGYAYSKGIGGLASVGGALSVPKTGFSGPRTQELIGGRLMLIVNKGRMMLYKEARAIYRTKMKTFKADIKNAETAYNRAKVKHEKATRDMRHLARKNAESMRELYREAAAGNTSAASQAKIAAQSDRYNYKLLEMDIKEADEEMEEAKKKLGKYQDEGLEGEAVRFFREQLDGKSKKISNSMKFKYKLDESEAATVERMLQNEVEYFSNYYAKAAISGATGILPALRQVGFAGQSFGEGVNSIFSNFWNLLTGPWVTGSLMALVMFYFMVGWIGYEPLLIFGLPIAAGLFFWVMNLTEAKTPLEWLAHFDSGFLSACEVVLVLYLLGVNTWV